jgi:alpha-tubulin suppressor-like RCC1 family protein
VAALRSGHCRACDPFHGRRLFVLVCLLGCLSTNLVASEVVSWENSGFSVQTNVLTNVTAIAAGMGHSLALKSDGQVVVWGNNGYGQTDMPADLTNVVAIAAGVIHSLALKSDGTVVAWGADGTNSGTWPNYGQSSVPSGLTKVVAISGGARHSLALKSDGTVSAWGDNYFGQTNVPAGLTNVVAIAAGGFHNLALRGDGTVAAWGDNSYGQIHVSLGLTDVVAIAGGIFHSLALRNDGTLVGWGMTRVPEQITGVVAIAAGTDISLALRADGTLYSWYIGNYFIYPGSPPAGLTNLVAISTKGGPGDGLALIGDGRPLLSTPLTIALNSNATFSVTLQSQSGRVYALEFKDSLTDNSWTALPLVAGNGRLLELSDSSATGAQRFYRVRRW